MQAADNCCACADGLIADGVDEMVAAVRKEVKFGSDWVKVLVTGAFMASTNRPLDSPENTHFSQQELEAVVAEAGRRKVGKRGSIRAGGRKGACDVTMQKAKRKRKKESTEVRTQGHGCAHSKGIALSHPHSAHVHAACCLVLVRCR